MSNGNFTVGLVELVKLSDEAYSMGRLLVLFIIFFGLLFYFGKLSREEHKLKKLSRFETDLKNYAQGLMILIILSSVAAFIAPTLTPEKLLKSNLSAFVFFGFVESLLIILIILQVAPKILERTIKTKTFWEIFKQSVKYGLSLGIITMLLIVLMVVIIPVLIVVFADQQQQQTYFYLSIIFVFILTIAYPYLSGKFSQPPEQIVSVYLSGSSEPLEDIALYQTTEVDYRFRKGDAEIVIPISQVQKIVYKTPSKEDSKTVSSEKAKAK